MGETGKFKKGDRVVITSSTNISHPLNKVLTVDYVGPEHEGARVHTFLEAGGCAMTDELELESIYNSPLYQALK